MDGVNMTGDSGQPSDDKPRYSARELTGSGQTAEIVLPDLHAADHPLGQADPDQVGTAVGACYFIPGPGAADSHVAGPFFVPDHPLSA